MTILKAIIAIAAGIIALMACLFFVASGMAHGSDDPANRKDAVITAFWSLVTFGLCAAVITMLSGCQAAKTIIDTCRDGLCR